MKERTSKKKKLRKRWSGFAQDWVEARSHQRKKEGKKKKEERNRKKGSDQWLKCERKKNRNEGKT